MTNALVRSEVQLSSQRGDKLGWTSWAAYGVSVPKDDVAVTDPEVIDLVVQLCTRIGMIMEDVSPLALDASREGLERRVVEIANAARAMATIADAAHELIGR